MATKTKTVYVKLTRDLGTGLVRTKCETTDTRVVLRERPDEDVVRAVAEFVKEVVDALR